MLSGSREEETPASALVRDEAVDDGAPVGPGEAEENALLAEERTVAAAATSVLGTDADTASGELPPMEDLVAKIPAPVRQLADELFRAKFYTVRRVPKSALK